MIPQNYEKGGKASMRVFIRILLILMLLSTAVPTTALYADFLRPALRVASHPFYTDFLI